MTAKRVHNRQTIVCQYCNREFTVPWSRRFAAKYCSRKCLRLGTEKQQPVEKTCLVCGTTFYVPIIRGNEAKYCSRKCYGAAMSKKGTVTLICKECGKEFFTSPSHSKKKRYCSRECTWKAKERDTTRYSASARRKIKHLGLLERCPQCGYDKYPKILEVHHIDRNPSNNTWDNLAIVCPNCHKAYHYMNAKLKLITVEELMTQRGLL